MTLELFLQEVGSDGFLSFADHTKATKHFGCCYAEIERQALSLDITPTRYQRNQSTITPQQQFLLFNTHIAVIGCGGLGGHIAEILTRIGIGTLTLVDHDHFEEHNLNRQNFSTLESLGREKVSVAKEALHKINPSIQITVHVHKFDPPKDMALLGDATLVIDALDDPAVKCSLAEVCMQRNLHFVHGAIAGFNGQFTTNSTLESLYPHKGRGAELQSGNPPFSVTLAASIQASEAIKLILGKGEPLKDNFLTTDLLYNEYEKFPL